jgi:GNAT superfamily N-acetyltransferase
LECDVALTIRKLQASDHVAWDKLFRDYIVFYEASVPDEIIDLTWQRVLAEADNMCGLIALDQTGKAVGIVNMVFHRSTWGKDWYCYLEDLFVSPDARGMGAGEALIKATYAEADRRGAERTYWATQEMNATARRLYDRVGELTEFVQYRR